jgi:soluble lytic murein transglycosylase-like protein
MHTNIPARDEYYLDVKSGSLVLKSKLSKRIRAIIMASTFLLATFLEVNLLANASYYNRPVDPTSKFSFVEAAMSSYVRTTNAELTPKQAMLISEATVKWAKEFKIEPTLLLAIAKVESGYNLHSISPAGAIGITQVIPRWHLEKMIKARDVLPTPELFDINTNIYLGAWIMSDCLKQFKHEGKALLCYNGSNAAPNGYDVKVQSAKKHIEKYIKSTT